MAKSIMPPYPKTPKPPYPEKPSLPEVTVAVVFGAIMLVKFLVGRKKGK